MRVLVVGAGMAALETVMALHALAGDRVAIALIAPEAELVYHPIAAKPPSETICAMSAAPGPIVSASAPGSWSSV